MNGHTFAHGLWSIGFLFWSSVVLAATPLPTSDTFYPAPLRMTNENAAPVGWRRDLVTDTQEACRAIHRSLYLIENRMARIKAEYKFGANFPVLYKHEAFYRKALTRRYEACRKTGVTFYKVGRCGTQQETLAFVRVTLGFVHSTVNLCDEYFSAPVQQRRDVLVHEFGRLENIGDDEKYTTNNIFVWDAITGRLSDNQVFENLVKP